jgi:hypothetical protein
MNFLEMFTSRVFSNTLDDISLSIDEDIEKRKEERKKLKKKQQKEKEDSDRLDAAQKEKKKIKDTPILEDEFLSILNGLYSKKKNRYDAANDRTKSLNTISDILHYEKYNSLETVKSFFSTEELSNKDIYDILKRIETKYYNTEATRIEELLKTIYNSEDSSPMTRKEYEDEIEKRSKVKRLEDEHKRIERGIENYKSDVTHFLTTRDVGELLHKILFSTTVKDKKIDITVLEPDYLERMLKYVKEKDDGYDLLCDLLRYYNSKKRHDCFKNEEDMSKIDKKNCDSLKRLIEITKKLKYKKHLEKHQPEEVILTEPSHYSKSVGLSKSPGLSKSVGYNSYTRKNPPPITMPPFQNNRYDNYDRDGNPIKTPRFPFKGGKHNKYNKTRKSIKKRKNF